MVCLGPIDPNGCPTETTCEKPTREIGYEGQQCPTYCPVHCTDEETHCPGVTDPYTGCKLPDQCLRSTHTDKDGKDCAVNCPVNCGPEDTHCAGHTNDIGCKEPDTCIKPATTFGIDGRACENFCETHCQDNEGKCGGDLDPFGCALPEMCVPLGMMKGENGTDCPLHCPKLCKENELFCAGRVDPNGCPTEELCIDAPKNDDGSWTFGYDEATHCPKYCPTFCEEDEVMCNQLLDTNGCPEVPICERPCQRKLTNEEEYCAVTCPVTCNKYTETKCPTYVDVDGCYVQETCVAKGADCAAPGADWHLADAQTTLNQG